MIRITTLIIASALSLVPVAASAEDVATAEVRYDDLNLNSKAGQATFETRINAAVRKVCGVGLNRNSLREQMDEDQCVNKARGEAIVLASRRSSQTLAVK